MSKPRIITARYSRSSACRNRLWTWWGEGGGVGLQCRRLTRENAVQTCLKSVYCSRFLSNEFSLTWNDSRRRENVKTVKTKGRSQITRILDILEKIGNVEEENRKERKLGKKLSCNSSYKRISCESLLHNENCHQNNTLKLLQRKPSFLLFSNNRAENVCDFTILAASSIIFISFLQNWSNQETPFPIKSTFWVENPRSSTNNNIGCASKTTHQPMRTSLTLSNSAAVGRPVGSWLRHHLVISASRW